jgi:hypothetical protein
MDVRGHLHDLAASQLVKNLSTHLNRRLYGPQTWSGCFGGQKNILQGPGFEHQISQPTAYTNNTIPVPLGPQSFTKCEMWIGILFCGNYREELREIITILQPDLSVIEKAIQ